MKIVFALVLLAGCGGGNNHDPFVGNWSCMGMSTTTYTAPAGMMPVTNMTSQTNSISDDGTGKLTLMRMPANNPPCTNTAKLGADKISFAWDPGQSCMLSGGLTQTFTSVTAEITPTGYSGTSTWTLSGTNMAGQMVTATGTAMNSCTKM